MRRVRVRGTAFASLVSTRDSYTRAAAAQPRLYKDTLAMPIDSDRQAPLSAVTVDAPARLHLGFLDPSASLGRAFGSLGLVIDGAGTELEASLAVADSIAGT